MVNTKASKDIPAKPENPGDLANPYWAMVKAREDINRELERMHQVKHQYEKAVEGFFDVLEKKPSLYKQQTVKGGKVTSVKLTPSAIRRFRNAFKKGDAASGTVQFFGDWESGQCPEKSWCVRLNCKPDTSKACSYLCFSTDPIQRIFE